MNVHAIKCLVEVEWNELWLGVREVFSVIHSVISLILISIQIAHGPFDLEPKTFPLQVVLVFVQFFRNIHPFNVQL